MKEKFITTLEPEIKKMLKIQAAREGIYANELLERLISLHVSEYDLKEKKDQE